MALEELPRLYKKKKLSILSPHKIACLDERHNDVCTATL